MPTAELLAPLKRVLLPAFSAVKATPLELKRLFLLTLGVQSVLVVPAAIGLSLVAPELVVVLLGDKWGAVVPLLEVLALVGVTRPLTAAGAYLLLALDRVRLAALIVWAEVAVFALMALSLFSEHEAQQIAWLRLVAAVVGVGLSIALVLHALPGLRLLEMLKETRRPLLAAAAMSVVVAAVANKLFLPATAALIAKVSIGALVFVATIFLLGVLRDGQQAPSLTCSQG